MLFGRYSFIDILTMLPIHDNSGALSGANYRSVWLIAPLVSGVAGLSASSSSKADTLNHRCENCEMLQLLWTVTEIKKTGCFVVNSLECIVTDIAVFSVVALKH